MFALRIAALAAATLSTGLIAGLFYGYVNSVMPALGQTDDRTLIDVMQRINVIIVNPLFMLLFMGTVGFTVLAAALHLGKDARTTLLWIGIAVVLNVIAFAVTSGLNVPLNNQLAAAGDPSQIGDLAAVRAQFETSWVRWNIVRAVLHALAFVALIGALFTAGVQHGRANAVAAPANPAVATGPAYQQPRGGFVAPVAIQQPQRFAPAPQPGVAPRQW
ncbi:DUF1772 domain-containing protein [Nocardia sp. NBC_01503]|uniref:anthrone oxygenase family protein n=1 Tax=Nocardia sp. NBC_01503 TaxID=2975997 RepID=UPI002E7B0412|nr:anthrone oxygenase family protein [Nocardia sp. NBC_01503]WTL34358.1 DUF1772 domain-containing protein [Nocardia sp. NBC_01503]